MARRESRVRCLASAVAMVADTLRNVCVCDILRARSQHYACRFVTPWHGDRRMAAGALSTVGHG